MQSPPDPPAPSRGGVDATLDAGDSLGRYRILRRLGSGAMGDVFLAEDPRIERLLAIKTLRFGALSSTEIEERTARLMREAKAAGRLNHPNVVTLFDVGEERGILFLAFEYVAGKDLHQRLLESAPLTLGEAIAIVRQAARGLDYAHRQGVVHRDVKPGNLLLDGEGRVKVSDFGIAKVLGQSTELTTTGMVIGSPQYLSPEQVRGEPLDGTSDVFSLGVVLYELLSGKPPFDGETLSTLVYQILHQEPPPVTALDPRLPAGLARLVGRMLAKQRDRRPATAGEVVEELARLESTAPLDLVLGGAGGAAPPTAPTRPLAGSNPPPSPPAPAGLAPPPLPPVPAPPAPGAVGAEPLPAAERAHRGSRLGWGLGAMGLIALLAIGALLATRGGERADSSAASGPIPAERESAAAPAPGSAAEHDAEGSARDLAAEPGVDRAAEGDGRARRLTAPSAEGSVASEPEVSAAAQRAETGRPASRPPAELRPAPPPDTAPREPQPGSPGLGLEPRAREPSADRPRDPGAGRGEASALTDSALSRRVAPGAAERRARQGGSVLDTGLEIAFNVQPADAYFLLDGRLIGKVSEYPPGEGFTLPGAGVYDLVLRKGGFEDARLRLRADSARGGESAVRLRLDPVPAAEVELGDLPLYRVSDAIAFRVRPPNARLLVDGVFRGPALQFAGRRGRSGQWLRLERGIHRLSFVAPGHRRVDIAVDFTAGATEKRQRITVQLPVAPTLSDDRPPR